MKKDVKVMVSGFVFGFVVAPFLAVLGLDFYFFEYFRWIFIWPVDFVNRFIPNVQEGGVYYIPFYKWIVGLGMNGIYWMIVFFVVWKVFGERVRKTS